MTTLATPRRQLSIRVTVEEWTRLREEHATTFAVHRLGWSAWLLARVLGASPRRPPSHRD